jgi:hypothetical protein
VDTSILSLSAEVENEWSCTVIPPINFDGVERGKFIFKLTLDISLFFLETNLWSVICMK